MRRNRLGRREGGVSCISCEGEEGKDERWRVPYSLGEREERDAVSFVPRGWGGEKGQRSSSRQKIISLHSGSKRGRGLQHLLLGKKEKGPSETGRRKKRRAILGLSSKGGGEERQGRFFLTSCVGKKGKEVPAEPQRGYLLYTCLRPKTGEGGHFL